MSAFNFVFFFLLNIAINNSIQSNCISRTTRKKMHVVIDRIIAVAVTAISVIKHD